MFPGKPEEIDAVSATPVRARRLLSGTATGRSPRNPGDFEQKGRRRDHLERGGSKQEEYGGQVAREFFLPS